MIRSSHSILALAMTLGALTVGCGTTSSGGGGGGTTIAGPRVEPCPTAGELRLGRICWNPVGSRWHLSANAPGGEYAFDVELLAAGRLRATDHPAATPGTDEWFVEGNTLRFFLGGRYVEYRADVTNGTVLVGQAANVRGDLWEWRGDRMPDETSCHPGEAQVDGACFSIAGTRWQVSPASGAAFDMIFEPGGALFMSSGATEATWEQAGTTITLQLNGQTVTVQVGAGFASLTGSGGMTFTATPLPSYPPPIH